MFKSFLYKYRSILMSYWGHCWEIVILRAQCTGLNLWISDFNPLIRLLKVVHKSTFHTYYHYNSSGNTWYDFVNDLDTIINIFSFEFTKIGCMKNRKKFCRIITIHSGQDQRNFMKISWFIICFNYFLWLI